MPRVIHQKGYIEEIKIDDTCTFSITITKQLNWETANWNKRRTKLGKLSQQQLDIWKTGIALTGIR
jgi:hypothetical protein